MPKACGVPLNQHPHGLRGGILHVIFTVNKKQRASSAQQCVPSGVQSVQIHKMSAKLK